MLIRAVPTDSSITVVNDSEKRQDLFVDPPSKQMQIHLHQID